MDTVVKGLIEDEDEKKGLVLFGRDVSKIPCFRDSFFYGILSGIGIGLSAFVKTSRPSTSTHIGMGGFVLSTMAYWSYCRYRWAEQRFNAELMQEALKDRLKYEGTAMEQQLEREGVLKKV